MKNLHRYYGPKYGRRAYSNIKWVYNFSPLTKWLTIIISSTIFAGSITFLVREITEHKQKEINQIEAARAKRVYLEKRLEKIKQETIDGAKKIIDLENQEKPMVKPELSNRKNDPQVYSWINEKGNRVYSNKKPSQSIKGSEQN